MKPVDQGKETHLTRPVPSATPEPGTVAAVIARLKALRAGTTLGGLSWKALRDQGRR